MAKERTYTRKLLNRKREDDRIAHRRSVSEKQRKRKQSNANKGRGDVHVYDGEIRVVEKEEGI